MNTVNLPPMLSHKEQNIILQVWLQPAAKENCFAGIYDNKLKIKIQAAAVDGKANAALCQFIAKNFALRINQVQIIRGLTSRNKTLQISPSSQQLSDIVNLIKSLPAKAS